MPDGIRTGRLRPVAARIAYRLPFGIGRRLRAYRQLAARYQQAEQRLRRLDRERTEQLARERDNALRYARAYRRLRAAALAAHPDELGPASPTAPAIETSLADRELIRRLRAESGFVQRLRAGDELVDALVELVRHRLAAKDYPPVRSLCQALQARPASRVAGCLGSALVAAETQLPELSWANFQQVPVAVWRRLAAGDYFKVGFRVDPAAAAATARGIAEQPPADLPPSAWLDIVRSAFGAGEYPLAGALLDAAESLASKAPAEWAATDPDRQRLRPWIERAVRPVPAATRPAGHLCLAVLDYKQPDWRQTSVNLGDYIQTLASLGQIARHANLRFHGDPALAQLAAELQDRVRPELRLDTAGRDVRLTAVNRDASGYDSIPDGTWVLAFGWYMERTFGGYDFPFHPHLRPIFVSFHCNRPELLTPAGIEYLRRYGPVGCRDWTTVDMLTGLGVPAFFTGCLTSTVDTLFPDLAAGEAPPPGAPIAYVDTRPLSGGERLRQEDAQVRQDGLVTNLRRSIELLETYRRRYSAVVTSRLHCYLPVRSLGVPAEFRPANPVDIRFEGLVAPADADLASMRRRLRDRLERVLTAIVAGEPEAEVYARWREQCAPDVAAAAARRTSLPRIPPPSFDIPAACAQIRSRQVTILRSAQPPGGGPEVHVALALDGNLKRELRVVIEAMTANTTSPLHLWILCRDHGSSDFQRLRALFPGVSFTWLPCDGVDYGDVLGMLKHITISTMDRLLLPDLLPELDRIVYHDLDALPLGDLTELYRWDLAGSPLAARSAVALDATSGFRNARRSARRLRDTPAIGYECLRRVYLRHGRDFTAFNAGILVLDLARMRADDFGREFIPFVERYGMNDQEVLNCYAGADRAVLPPRWNAFPTQEIVTDPSVIHWAGALKPWRREYVSHREVWAEYAGRVSARAATIAPD